MGPVSLQRAIGMAEGMPCRPGNHAMYVEASVENLKQLLSNREIVKQIFPGEVIFNYGGPCGAISINGDLLLETDKLCVIENDGARHISMTLTRVNYCKLGLALTIDYYGPPEIHHLFGHVHFVLGKLNELYVRGEIQLGLVLPQAMNVEQVMSDFDAQGFTCHAESIEKYYISQSEFQPHTTSHL